MSVVDNAVKPSLTVVKCYERKRPTVGRPQRFQSLLQEAAGEINSCRACMRGQMRSRMSVCNARKAIKNSVLSLSVVP